MRYGAHCCGAALQPGLGLVPLSHHAYVISSPLLCLHMQLFTFPFFNDMLSSLAALLLSICSLSSPSYEAFGFILS